MRALALVGLTLPASDPAASRQWWASSLELPTAEDDDSALDLGEVPLRFGPALELRLVSYDVQEPVPFTDPSGAAVVLVPPDRAGADRAEESIRSFIDGAADLAGRPVAELADEVTAIVLEAKERIRAVVIDQPNDKRLAVHLELGQRARRADGAPPWHLHAASTLMSDTFGPGAES